MQNFKSDALKLFSGCDNGIEEAGTAQNRAIWAFGIEFGTFNSQLDGAPKKEGEDEYAISCQKQWPYNQNLFKFLSAMDPAYGLEKWEKFAEDKQPFVLKKSQGFFKGNLFPMGCRDIKSWPQRNIDQTGFHTKAEYVQWCIENRLPEIYKWVQTYRPKLFIGSGISYDQEFGQAVFGKKITFNQEKFQMDSNSRIKRILWHQEDDIKLIILQHFSVRGNSHEALKAFGQFAQKFLEA